MRPNSEGPRLRFDDPRHGLSPSLADAEELMFIRAECGLSVRSVRISCCLKPQTHTPIRTRVSVLSIYFYLFLVVHRVTIYGFLDFLNLERPAGKRDCQDPNRCVGFGLSFPNRQPGIFKIPPGVLGLGIKYDVRTSPQNPIPRYALVLSP